MHIYIYIYTCICKLDFNHRYKRVPSLGPFISRKFKLMVIKLEVRQSTFLK